MYFVLNYGGLLKNDKLLGIESATILENISLEQRWCNWGKKLSRFLGFTPLLSYTTPKIFSVSVKFGHFQNR